MTAGLADLVQAALKSRGAAERIRSSRGMLPVRPCGTDAQDRHPDLVVETPLADPAEARAAASAYRETGYRVEVAALATSEALSHLAALTDFLTSAGEHDEPMSWADHDACAQSLLEVLALLEADQLVDRVTVLRADHTVLYDNELIDGAWRRHPAAGRVVAYEWARPWSAQEAAVFRRDLIRTER
ncbi:zeta toxin family protein [Streptomyces sp. NPDC002033]|uniref:zeta toxin family protein n=1 Tax=unclassified Streptomyces TaxID=2593676 RepID=UPI00331EA83D